MSQGPPMLEGSHLPREERIAALRLCLQEARRSVIQQARAGQPVPELMRLYAGGVQRVLVQLWEVARAEAGLLGPGDPTGICLIARGGFGRRQLAPFSDLDVAIACLEEGDVTLDRVARQFFVWLSDVLLANREFEVGYAYHLLEDCGKLPLTSVTALLDARLIAGDPRAYGRFAGALLAGLDLPALVHELSERRKQRLPAPGCGPYAAEPDLKLGAGGLRDLQALRWLARACYQVTEDNVWVGLYMRRLCSRYRYDQLVSAERFLLAARFWLQVFSGRRSDLLSRSYQGDVARALGYSASSAAVVVEQLMADHFRHAAAVRLAFEEFWNQCWSARLSLGGSLFLSNRQIEANRSSLFSERPESLVRVFMLCHRLGVTLSPTTTQMLEESLSGLPTDPGYARVQEALLAVLRLPAGTAEVLRKMADSGVLRHCFPGLARLMDLVPHDLQHEYSVGEHSLRVVEELESLRQSSDEQRQLYREVLEGLERPELLTLAGLLHDLGKLEGSSHSEGGAAAARAVAESLGLNQGDADTVEFLVRHHLLMAETASLRDLRDERAVRDFTGIVETSERLDLLLLLSYADAKAVGPSVWTGMLDRRLQELYLAATRSLDQQAGSAELADAAAIANHLYEDLGPEEIEPSELSRHLQLMPPAYLLNTERDQIAADVRSISRVMATGRPVVRFRRDRISGMTELTICAYDDPHPGLLSKIVGTLYAHHLNLRAAQIHTRPEAQPIAIDTLWLDLAGKPLAEYKQRQVATDLISVLTGAIELADLLSGRGRAVRPRLSLESLVLRDDLSDSHTVLEAAGEDTEGLVFALTSALAALGLSVSSAHLTTLSGRARHTFYISTSDGRKLSSREADHTRQTILGLYSGR